MIAVEAHPTTFAMLRRTVELNHLTNITLVQAAVMDRPGTVAISDEVSPRLRPTASETRASQNQR